MNKRIAVITGASSGMGQEFVRQLDICTRYMDEVWVIARREERLLELKKEMTHFDVRVIPLDICNNTDLDKLSELLAEEMPDVRLLVNAAGVGKAGRFVELSHWEIGNMINVNCKALLEMTHRVLPYMKRNSRIIQVASASAFMPQKEFSVYAASKALVLSFSRALRAEIRDMGISLTVVCPGPIKTEFLEISNGGQEQKPLKKLVTVSVEPVVAKALRDAKAGKELSIYGIPMQMVYVASKILPHGLFLK
ncbi:MAG: SDR family NAD(P)-dependent oxidoreductase [Lachnospiraceae bacterium]|nr:SDR family NAD(P)-dependent oxidoreductase [Lachnospiraceae bacterium]